MNKILFFILQVFLLISCEKPISVPVPVITSGDPSVKAEPAGQHYLDVLDTLYYTPGTTRARLDISTDLYWDVTDMNYGLVQENKVYIML